MAKTYYLGFTKAGRPVGRGSANDYGFTHAAVKTHPETGAPSHSLPSFSTSAQGAQRNAGDFWNVEIVAVQVVDGKTYREAMKAAV